MEPRRMDVGFPPATSGPALPPPGASLFGCVRPMEGGNGRGGDEAKLNSCSTSPRIGIRVRLRIENFIWDASGAIFDTAKRT